MDVKSPSYPMNPKILPIFLVYLPPMTLGVTQQRSHGTGPPKLLHVLTHGAADQTLTPRRAQDLDDQS